MKVKTRLCVWYDDVSESEEEGLWVVSLDDMQSDRTLFATRNRDTAIKRACEMAIEMDQEVVELDDMGYETLIYPR